MSGIIYHGDNSSILPNIKEKSISLIYIDPPFNTNKVQVMKSIKTKQDVDGNRIGFNGKKYSTEIVSTKSYNDKFDDYIGFIKPKMEMAYNLLADNGSLYFHIDYRESAYCKIMLDEIFGRECFLNEIIWQYDFGSRSKTKWSAKHDTILFYCKDPKNYTFNYDQMDRLPYLAPGLCGKEKAARGKTPTDVWWITICPTNGKERTKYPTQKNIKILNRIIKISSNENDTVLDFFAGSGTTGDACYQLNRNFILIDSNIEAIEVMKKRFETFENVKFE